MLGRVNLIRSVLEQVWEAVQTCSQSWGMRYLCRLMVDECVPHLTCADLRHLLQVVRDAGKELGLPELQVAGFVRFQCGEGLEREQTSFVEEVTQTLQGTG